jgi:hypothetical protein
LSNVNCEFGCSQFKKYHKNNYNPNWKFGATKMNSLAEWAQNAKTSKSTVHVDLQEVNDNGEIIDKKKKSLFNFNKMKNN